MELNLTIGEITELKSCFFFVMATVGIFGLNMEIDLKMHTIFFQNFVLDEGKCTTWY